MKTSTKISIAFALFTLGSMLTLYITAKQHKDVNPQLEEMKNYMLQPSFSVVVAEKGADLHINQSDSNMISVECLKNQQMPAKMYAITGDTLHVYGGLRTFVKCKNLKTVVGNKHAWLGIYKFAPDSITLIMKGGQMHFSNQDIEEKPFNITITGSDSAYVEIRNANCNRLTATGIHSTMDIYCSVKTLKANIKNKSELTLRHSPVTIELERDTTSRFNGNF